MCIRTCTLLTAAGITMAGAITVISTAGICGTAGSWVLDPGACAGMA